MKTIWTCVAFALLGGFIMALVALAVTQPLKRISSEMLSMAKLEFLAAHKPREVQGSPLFDMDFVSKN